MRNPPQRLFFVVGFLNKHFIYTNEAHVRRRIKQDSRYSTTNFKVFEMSVPGQWQERDWEDFT
jgi:hypothetical protein